MSRLPVAILAGGLGTRLAEQTEVKPKPMVEIGGRPILWHIMKHFAHYGHEEFYVALGYKGESIKRYFLDYYTLNGSMTVDLRTGRVDGHERECEDWIVHLMETGPETPTGGRIRRLRPHLQNGTFLATYGDGVSNIDIDALLSFHRAHGRIATISAVRPPARFGGIVFEDDRVACFSEKPQTGEGWINGGFMALEPEIFDYLPRDGMHLEADVLERLAAGGELMAYRHEGFWQCMDTLRDMRLLDGLWQSGKAPWKVWERAKLTELAAVA
jgi:glucose-1-phosphate cytidylyltransferase